MFVPVCPSLLATKVTLEKSPASLISTTLSPFWTVSTPFLNVAWSAEANATSPRSKVVPPVFEKPVMRRLKLADLSIVSSPVVPVKVTFSLKVSTKIADPPAISTVPAPLTASVTRSVPDVTISLPKLTTSPRRLRVSPAASSIVPLLRIWFELDVDRHAGGVDQSGIDHAQPCVRCPWKADPPAAGDRIVDVVQ